MEQHARLKARIANLKELGDLVRMTRGVAAGRLQQAQEALKAVQRYVAIVESSIATAAALLPRKYVEVAPVGPQESDEVLIVVASEHGFVGGFNDHLVEQAAQTAIPGLQTGIIGRRACALAGERGLSVDWSFPMATHVTGVLNTTHRVAEHLAGVAGANVMFGRYTGTGSYKIETRRILPLDPSLLETPDHQPSPLHHLPPAALVEQLAREYLFAEICRAIMESMVTENAVRLRVMESAADGIDDKVGKLTDQERSLRQQEITTELVDVVTGAAAVLGEDTNEVN